ncbi:MAG: hypothetical protein BMS9Abin36_2059 [Gammaproteobacteria bacterium]|nr:MAG: hypothetical protein BMS9Abin36_2059 [Gammaproteobacteria bacterium]
MPAKSVALFWSPTVKLPSQVVAMLPWAQAACVEDITSLGLLDAGAVLVLTPEQACLLAEKGQTATVLADTVWVLWADGSVMSKNLQDHPRVVGVLDERCTNEVMYATLRSAAMRMDTSGAEVAHQQLEAVLEVGRALASEKDLDTLLGLVLKYARRLTGADGSSIYTRDPNGKLYFRLWQNASTDSTSDAQKTLVGKDSIAGYVARTGKVVELDDAYAIPKGAPYHFNPASDHSIGYHTRSMLTLPLKNKDGKIVGVLQLINRKQRPDAILKTAADCDAYVLSFDEQSQGVAQALAGQAGVAVENSLLHADIEKLFEVGRALASEKDLDILLGLILEYARGLTGADGSSIYTRDPNGKLYFRLWQNASTDSTSDAQKTLVGENSIAGYVARSGEMVVLDDTYAIPKGAPYHFNSASDHSIGYHTRSMLTMPLKNKEDDVVGVLQLINRKQRPDAILKTAADCDAYVLPFDEQSQGVALALAGQAGVAVENSILYADIEKLFEGFIRASVQAIEARDPTTAGHSERVAEFTERLAKAVDRSDMHGLAKTTFSREQLREIRYASLLHDFGKVGVREDVLVKAKKLYPHKMDKLQDRFQFARASIQRKTYLDMLMLYDADDLSPEELAARRREIEAMLAEDSARLQRYQDIVQRANEPAVSYTEVSDELDEVATYRFPGTEGDEIQLLDAFEFEDLKLAKGSLNHQERSEIESHVSHTYAFLSLIPWTRNLANLPNIAYGHHEKLDGTGYPRGLSEDEIPVQARMMTVSDIYDALTSADRPYKKGLPVERALDILHSEAKAGKIDGSLLKIFIESEAYSLISAWDGPH